MFPAVFAASTCNVFSTSLIIENYNIKKQYKKISTFYIFYIF